ncbi:MAG: TerB family tellurite resistance protein [Bacteroidota bacterium]|nr:TerB family tellurite resistance protein [Bacteroidota bacterium]
MQHQDKSWTHIHDNALVFLALAYSSDADLSDSEVDTISEALRRWKPKATDREIHEVVMESAAIFFESDAEREVVLSVRTLGEALNIDQRRQVLEDVMRVAEADGVLLNAEQNLLSVLAGAWDIKATKDRLI